MTPYVCGERYRRAATAAEGNDVSMKAVLTSAVLDVTALTVLGMDEYVKETLEMMECAYPSLAGPSGLLAQYKPSLHTPSSSCSSSSSSGSKAQYLVKALATESCDVGWNNYADLYATTVRAAFFGRHKLMKSSTGKWCRRRNKQ
jgi:hypothetical protein